MDTDNKHNTPITYELGGGISKFISKSYFIPAKICMENSIGVRIHTNL
jgi:hypothetical protein